VNEEPTLKSYLDLTLMQHPFNENPKLQKVRACLEVDPFRTWYYHISLNFGTLMILLQVNFVSSNEPKIVCEGCNEIEDTSIFAWFSIIGARHYRWLHSTIHRLPPNNKADYLVHTIRHILNFLQL
jgi:hypothetical protein